MHRTIPLLLAALALAVPACGDDDTAAPTTTTDTTSADEGTTTTTTSTPGGGQDWTRCENPEGFAVSSPADWVTNDGSVVEPCSQFDPEPFDVPEATDERVAAITAYVDPVPYSEVGIGQADTQDERALTAVDGHQAVRIEGPAGELYPDGATSVRYLIDLDRGLDDEGAGTLFLDTVELTGMDFGRNVAVLDRMVRTLELTGAFDADRYPDQTVVARYEGGGNTFSAGGSVVDDEVCIAAPLDESTMETCFATPADEDVAFGDLSGELFPLFVGVTGEEVFRVELEQASSTTSYLPVAIEGTDTRGFALPSSPTAGARITWFDLAGEQLGSRDVART